ncbi:3-deoxy-D-arabinoheptulosonate-7-phosphate synthase [Geothermobacter ehrlichii]|uniref:3-deoxy-D-arabinoheptulosonate-7-phosphate synthase n=1 Tax=Geothermobacter ehrlichii TaxID=213224 RepID=A0A5D3WLX4_9BACT|nr:3-deoxy-7-phosphoheptulonate synthase [Geothermobacter ehrlichii]TYO99193.1 3-deoxy-D-arabinoheptulosonate-7-phosphate synthase [Geothermobacter ehrlichii]
MIIVMKSSAGRKELAEVKKRIRELGYKPHVIHGTTRNVVGAVGDERGKAVLQTLQTLPGVESVVPILKPYKLAGREVKPEPTLVEIVPGLVVGGEEFVVMAGPCSVECESQILETARAVKAAGARLLRGGAFKPRTSPYAFQGLEEEGLKLLALAREETGLPVVTEVVNPRDVELVARYADVMQVGARNVQNFALLKMLGQLDKPILLKRGMSTTIQEYLMSAEYILAEGNRRVILCERGIRTFETATRNTLDIAAVPVLKNQTHLPVIVDPSHATGHAHLVPPMCYAAAAAGADGLIVEVHPHPEDAASDGPQSLRPEDFRQMMTRLAAFTDAAGRTLNGAD